MQRPGGYPQGRRGQLYFDCPDLCLMVLDGPPAIRSKWKELGRNLWMGDISPIPPENAKLAHLRVPSQAEADHFLPEAQAAVAAAALEATSFLATSPAEATPRRRIARRPWGDGQRRETSGNEEGLFRCTPP